MKRIRLIVAYDGTNYKGWQIQPNGVTIESKLNECLSEICGEEIQVKGASRTDSGVHAYGNIAVFDTNARMPGEKYAYALNQRLPEDIRIQGSDEVDLDFHPRFCKTRKTYEYRIYHSKFPMPCGRQYCHFTYFPIDVDKMKEAARYLVGEHDFASFCSINAQVKTTVRTLYEVAVIEEGKEIMIRLTGNGFLYNMVRIIAGTLLQVGYGKIEPSKMREIIEAKNREAAGPTAPAQGLTLVSYAYENEENALGHMSHDELQ